MNMHSTKMTFEVWTRVDEKGEIQQEIKRCDTGEVAYATSRHVLHAREEQIRDALIALGWKPPQAEPVAKAACEPPAQSDPEGVCAMRAALLLAAAEIIRLRGVIDFTLDSIALARTAPVSPELVKLIQSRKFAPSGPWRLR